MHITYPSIAKFSDFVQLKDYRPPTKREYVRYWSGLDAQPRSDPADRLRSAQAKGGVRADGGV